MKTDLRFLKTEHMNVLLSVINSERLREFEPPHHRTCKRLAPKRQTKRKSVGVCTCKGPLFWTDLLTASAALRAEQASAYLSGPLDRWLTALRAFLPEA